MGLGDLGNVVIILIIFMFLHLLIALSVGITTIKNNWDEYKCNPSVMPFADIFGHDVKENYDECIKSTQIDFMSSFLEPIFGSLEIFADTGNSFLKTFDEIKLFGLSTEGTIGNIFSELQGKIMNMGNELSNMYIVITDTFGNLFSVITVFYYMVQGGIITTETIFNENISGVILDIVSGGENTTDNTSGGSDGGVEAEAAEGGS
jgi:hypothetical protein